MAEPSTVGTLTIRRGAKRGRKFTLKGDAFRIGKDDDCDLVLTDEYVSGVHTVIENRSDVWVVTNRGATGTLVNENAIAGTQRLADNDLIQVGAETLLEFDTVAVRQTEKPTGPVPFYQRPIVVAGAVAYLIAMLVLFWLISGPGDVARGELTPELKDQVIAAAQRFLSDETQLLAGPAYDPKLLQAAARDADPAATYYAIVAATQNGQPTEELIRQVSDHIDAQLYRAWQYESQHRYSDAIAIYENLAATIPTIRCKATAFAVQRIRELEARAEDG